MQHCKRASVWLANMGCRWHCLPAVSQEGLSEGQAGQHQPVRHPLPLSYSLTQHPWASPHPLQTPAEDSHLHGHLPWRLFMFGTFELHRNLSLPFSSRIPGSFSLLGFKTQGPRGRELTMGKREHKTSSRHEQMGGGSPAPGPVV